MDIYLQLKGIASEPLLHFGEFHLTAVVLRCLTFRGMCSTFDHSCLHLQSAAEEINSRWSTPPSLFVCVRSSCRDRGGLHGGGLTAMQRGWRHTQNRHTQSHRPRAQTNISVTYHQKAAAAAWRCVKVLPRHVLQQRPRSLRFLPPPRWQPSRGRTLRACNLQPPR